MLAEKSVASPVVTETTHRMTFFRQSGWMMIATMVSGVFMAAVHTFSKVIPDTEYSALGVMIGLLNWMTIPGLGLQMVFAHQTSSAVTPEQRRRLVGTCKAAMRWTFYVWLVMAVIVVADNQRLVTELRLSNPWSLWFTLFAALMMVWLPIFNGLLQGRQNFLWMGWVAIINGAGRIAFGALIVMIFKGLAAGILAGVLLALVTAVACGFQQNLDLWNEPSEAFDARGWLRHIIPLTLGCGVATFLLSADVPIVQNYMGDEGATAPYFFGGTLARAIVWFTGPLAAVMFPKLVHRKARAQKGGANLFLLTLLGTVVLASLAAASLTVMSPLLIRIGSKPAFATSYIVPLMPLFAWAMVPLAVGNVLLNNLMAHSRFKIVPVLLALAVGYWIALQHFHASFKMVIETLGTFNLLFLAVCALFTWLDRSGENVEAP